MRKVVPLLLVASLALSGCSLFKGDPRPLDGATAQLIVPPDADLVPPPPGAMSRSGAEATITQAILAAPEGDGQAASVQIPQ